jgi:hypothetical protein
VRTALDGACMAATRAALAVLVVCCLAGGTLHSTGAAPCVPAPALGRVLRLRGAGASNLAGLVYADGDAAACMGATVRAVRPRSSPRDAAEDTIVAAFDALVKLANATGDAAAQTGAAHGAEQREDRWWEQPNTTRDDILAYLRARDPAVPDTDDRPRLNAELAAAAAGGSMRKIRELVAQGAQVNAGGTASGMWAPLHHAARHRHLRAVRALLNLDARVNITTWGRWTPLHLAAAVGAGEIARMLLEVRVCACRRIQSCVRAWVQTASWTRPRAHLHTLPCPSAHASERTRMNARQTPL